jgi:radical SAM superfamily enzyme with C-terminal helix-hairpin-helix motif
MVGGITTESETDDERVAAFIVGMGGVTTTTRFLLAKPVEQETMAQHAKTVPKFFR